MKRTFFVKGLSGEKSKKGKPYTMITVMEAVTEENVQKTRLTELYAEAYMPNVNELKFGDEIEVVTREGDWIGSKPILEEIVFVADSPIEF